MLICNKVKECTEKRKKLGYDQECYHSKPHDHEIYKRMGVTWSLHCLFFNNTEKCVDASIPKQSSFRHSVLL